MGLGLDRKGSGRTLIPNATPSVAPLLYLLLMADRRKYRHRRAGRFSGLTRVGRQFDQVILWTLRGLVLTDVTKKCHNDIEEYPYNIEKIFRLDEYAEEHTGAHCVRKYLGELLQKYERRQISRSTVIHRNIELIGKMLKLKKAEKELLLFMTFLNSEEILKELFEYSPTMTSERLVRLLAKVLDLRTGAVRAALDRKSILMSTGIIENTPYSVTPLELNERIQKIMISEHANTEDMTSNFFNRSPAPALGPDSYPHVRMHADMLARLLALSARHRKKGVNILLWGPPGTGKTQLARTIAQEAGLRLYEVGVQDSDREAMDRDDRLNAYRLCQVVLEKRKTSAVLFDEVEDVFCHDAWQFLGLSTHKNNEKGFMNRLLETNPVPSIWITNSTGHMDPAALRRFDFVLEMDTPPRAVRQGILEKYLSGSRMPEKWIRDMSKNESLTPADVEKLAAMLGALEPEDAQKAGKMFEAQARQRLKVRGRRLRPLRKHLDLIEYDLSFVNADCDLEELAASLGTRPAGTMCLYGPPGTGKTQFAHFLAKRLDKPLVKKQASDILSMWVGGTEHNIARMFEQAREEKAVLLLDEADSFLQSRQSAHRSWEVTQVNELLVQMEAFEGLFICSTNLMDSVDAASLRRFVMKIEFGFMNNDQKWRMFVKTAEKACHSIQDDDESLRPALDRIKNLTPGDFAVILRKQHMLDRKFTPAQVLEMLEQESGAKNQNKSVVRGFGG